MSRKVPDDNTLLNNYSASCVPKSGKYKEGDCIRDATSQELLDTFKASKEYAPTMERLRKQWLKDAITNDIEQAVLNEAMLQASGKWDEAQASKKKLQKLYDELMELGDDK